MKSLLFVFLFAGSMALSHTTAVALERDTTDFVLVRENNGITLYERWYPITEDLLAREVKATFRINAGAEAAIALIRDESKGTRWNKHTRIYRVLQSNDDAWFGYIEYDLPWPVSNQDCVLEYRRIHAPGYLKVEFNAADHPSFPVGKKTQRIPEISGKWIFKEGDTGIDVEYYITTTPSETLPAWITDPIIRNNLIETLGAFRGILEAPRLANALR